MKQLVLIPQYVDYIPEQLQDGHLYICEKYKTIAHKCCCGCGEEVITPLSPAEWSIRQEGNTVTLHPSIGNWSFKCQSHYWIRKNQVIWAKAMTKQEIKRVRARDAADKASYIAQVNQQKAKTGSATYWTQLWARFIEWIKQ
jgi:hypothetical protein